MRVAWSGYVQVRVRCLVLLRIRTKQSEGSVQDGLLIVNIDHRDKVGSPIGMMRGYRNKGINKDVDMERGWFRIKLRYGPAGSVPVPHVGRKTEKSHLSK